MANPIGMDIKKEDLIVSYKNKNDEPKLYTETQGKIIKACDNFRDFLLEKNKRYGDSALNPLNVFSKHDAGSSICIRLDDKLKRIQNANELRKNDTSDMIGYLFLLCIEKDWLDFKDLLD